MALNIPHIPICSAQTMCSVISNIDHSSSEGLNLAWVFDRPVTASIKDNLAASMLS